jgi:hypothetical protein
MSASYRFEMQERVRVLPSRGGHDPGGEGRITAREKKEDNRGEVVLYRVLIEGHEQQKRVADDKGRENAGFWYADELVVPLE